MATIGPGFGEGYALDWYGSTTPTVATVTSAWTTLLSSSSLQNWQAKLKWKTVRLGFLFKDLSAFAPSAISYQLDSTNADGTLSALDAVIELLNTAGYNVMLCFMTENVPSDLPTANALIQDWANIAKHYAGDTRIAAYQIANEMGDNTFLDTTYGGSWSYETSTYTSGHIPYLWNITKAIRVSEPNRAIVIPDTQENIYNFNMAVNHTRSQENLIADFHVSTYTQNNNKQYNGCMENSQVFNWPFLNFWTNYWAYHIPIINGELNAIYSQCNCYTTAWLDTLIAGGYPYICWGYKEYESVWDAAIQNVIPA
jgi:hypothetical protein